jgi:hypothetical protein
MVAAVQAGMCTSQLPRYCRTLRSALGASNWNETVQLVFMQLMDHVSPGVLQQRGTTLMRTALPSQQTLVDL